MASHVTQSQFFFKGWNFGMRNDGNLLGTIKSLDMLGVQTLNCTENAGQRVHDVCTLIHTGLSSRLAFRRWFLFHHTGPSSRLLASGIAPLRVGTGVPRRLGYSERH